MSIAVLNLSQLRHKAPLGSGHSVPIWGLNYLEAVPKGLLELEANNDNLLCFTYHDP